ncbi:Zn-ribbon domain-containing OB-fold protein [Croceicoccus ponticola]|nr:OB-fold domain-containing protein [Croceicoccus ponticola]
MVETLQPIRNLLNDPFWKAAKEGCLIMPYCLSSGRYFWPPSPVSPFRTGGVVEWREAETVGTLVSIVTYRRAFQEPLKDRLPYAVGLVELVDQVRLLAHFAISPANRFPVMGESVEIFFAALEDDGEKVPHFRAL